MTRVAAWGCLAAAAVAAAGCALAPLRAPVDEPRQAFEQRTQSMRAVDEWEIRGRLAVRTRERGETISMVWRRDRGEHYINLYGPMGAGRVVLTTDASGATLKTSQGETYHDASAEDLLYRVTGWRVPFAEMQHWVLGVAAPDSRYELELDEWGRLRELTQNGWRIGFDAYHHDEGRADLPRKLVIDALPGAGGGPTETVQVKALIKHWERG